MFDNLRQFVFAVIKFRILNSKMNSNSSSSCSCTDLDDSYTTMPNYIMGIDMGTTSIKVCIMDLNKKILASTSKPTLADIPSDYAGPGSLQDVPKIIHVLQECIEKLPKELLEKVFFFFCCFFQT